MRRVLACAGVMLVTAGGLGLAASPAAGGATAAAAPSFRHDSAAQQTDGERREVMLEGDYRLSPGSKVHWWYTGHGHCIKDVATDVTQRVGDGRSRAFPLFNVPSGCGPHSSSGTWEVTVITAIGEHREGKVHISTQSQHSAHAECLGWRRMDCVGGTDVAEPDDPSRIVLKVTIGPISYDFD